MKFLFARIVASFMILACNQPNKLNTSMSSNVFQNSSHTKLHCLKSKENGFIAIIVVGIFEFFFTKNK